MQTALRAGFTLVEMMVVLAIIGTLAMLVGPSVLRSAGAANVATARAQIESLAIALEAYSLDTGTFPTTEQGLAALRTRPAEAVPGWRGPYLRKAVPDDPWGRPYVYVYPAASGIDQFHLYSLGRDGTPGGAGDDADITASGEPVPN